MTDNIKYATFRMYETTRDKIKYKLLPLLKEKTGRNDLTMIKEVDRLVDEKIEEIQEEEGERL